MRSWPPPVRFLRDPYATFALSERCEAFGLNPADEFGLANEWMRWCFNNAVFTLGRLTNNKLREFDTLPTGERRPKYTLEDILEGFAYQPRQDISALLFFNSGAAMDL